MSTQVIPRSIVLLSPILIVSLWQATALAQPHYRDACARPDATGKRCHLKVLVDDTDKPVRFAGPSGLGATDLEQAYNLPTTGGNGRIIATELGSNHYANAEADLNTYRSQWGLAPCTSASGCFIQIDGTGGKNFGPDGKCGDLLEDALDLQMLSAGCPDCSIMLIEVGNGQSDDQAIAAGIAKGAVGISFSWNTGESQGDNSDMTFMRPGIGLFASSGDASYYGDGMTAAYPAAGLGVVGVGGTVLTKSSSARGWDETAWSNGGSGCAQIDKKPSWQTDPSCGKKMVADVSAVASGITMYCSDSSGGQWYGVGGTSVSSPFVAGALAVIGALDGKTFDPSWVYSHSSGFYDVTSGSNGTCSTQYFCNATTGYDGPTGLGTPNGQALLTATGGSSSSSSGGSASSSGASGSSSGSSSSGASSSSSSSGSGSSSGGGIASGSGSGTSGSSGSSGSSSGSSSSSGGGSSGGGSSGGGSSSSGSFGGSSGSSGGSGPSSGAGSSSTSSGGESSDAGGGNAANCAPGSTDPLCYNSPSSGCGCGAVGVDEAGGRPMSLMAAGLLAVALARGRRSRRGD